MPQDKISLKDYVDDSPAKKTPLFSPPPGYVLDEPHMANPEEMTQVAKDAAPYAGRLAANTLPLIGSLAGYPGIIAGNLASQGLRSAAPKIFGEGPQDPIDFAKSLGVDLMTQGLIPNMINKLATRTGSYLASKFVRNFPAVKEGAAKEMSGQIMKGLEPNSQILEGAAQDAKGLFDNLKGEYDTRLAAVGDKAHPAVKEALDDLKDKFGKNSVGKALVRLQKEYELGGDVAKSQTYQSIANKALSDLTHVRNWKLVAHPQAVADLAANKLLTNGFKESKGAIDANKVLEELEGKSSEVYKEALGDSFGSLKEALGEIKNQQKEGITDKVLSYSKGHLLWAVPLALSGHSILSPVGAVATGAVLTNSMLAKAMTNSQTAKLVVQALRTSSSAPQADFIHKALMGSLRAAEDVATVPEK